MEKNVISDIVQHEMKNVVEIVKKVEYAIANVHHHAINVNYSQLPNRRYNRISVAGDTKIVFFVTIITFI